MGIQRCLYPNMEHQLGETQGMSFSDQVRRRIGQRQFGSAHKAHKMQIRFAAAFNRVRIQFHRLDVGMG